MTTTQQPPTGTAPAPTTPLSPMDRSTRRLIVTIGSVLAVLIVLALAVPALSRLLESTERTSHALPADLTSLTVDSNVGDIEVRAVGPGEVPGAVATVRSGLAAAEADVVTTGASATLSDTCRNRWWENCSVQWEVLVPADAAVTVDSAVGDITVVDLAGTLSVNSSVGSLTATGLRSDSVTARSSVGDVTLDLVTAPSQVRASSSTGDLTVTVPADDTTYLVTTSTSVGDVRNGVGSDNASTRTIDVRTSVGDITLRRS